MFCPKCGSEIAEGAAFCGKCGAPVGAQAAGAAQAGSAQGAAGAAVGGTPALKKNGAKIGAVAAAVVVVVVLVAGFATNWFGLAGVQPKEAVEVPAASQGADEAQGANAADGQSADANESAGDAQGGSQAAASVTVKSAVEAYTWDELSQISAEIGAAGDEAAAVEVAKRYNLCTPEGMLDGTQVKSVTLADGTQTTVQIVGFAHDDKTAGGKAGITFIFGDCVGEAPMNSTDTNAGGWEASQMRAYLNGDWRTQLPQDLDAVIVPVDKLSNNVGETDAVSAVTTTSDALWLFSLSELAGAVPAGRTGEGYGLFEEGYVDVLDAAGSQYGLFCDMGVGMGNSENACLVKTRTDTYAFWWLRTSEPRDGYCFLRVDQHGYTPSGSDGASCANYMVPGFCI